MEKRGVNILLTGGAGFIGKAIIHELLEAGSPIQLEKLRVFDLSPDPGYTDSRMQWVRGDIRNATAIAEACCGIDLVFHAAAIVDWGTTPKEEVLAVNYTGTAHVIRACLEQQVKHLVYTSSLDAIFGGMPLVDIDERLPYPEKHPNMYCRSKCMAEKLVMESNTLPGLGLLTTCILRPADVYGPGDPFHIGALINMAKSGFYVRLGTGSSVSQHVYVGNIAWAHIQAADALIHENQATGGNVYFITDGPPSNFFKFFDAIVAGAGYRIWPRNIWIPRPVAYVMGAVAEFVALVLRPVKKYHPGFSRFAVLYTCSNFTFSSDKAKRDFGFTPKYSREDAYQMTVDFYRQEKVRNGAGQAG